MFQDLDQITFLDNPLMRGFAKLLLNLIYSKEITPFFLELFNCTMPNLNMSPIAIIDTIVSNSNGYL